MRALDIRVLLTNVRAQSAASSGTTIPNCPFPTPQPLSHSPEVVLTDFPLQDPEKVLKELIEPYSLRVQMLREFLQDIKPSLDVEIVPLNDPFGVSVVDRLLQCIVVSEETRKGGEAGLPALILHEIQLLKDAHHTETEEEKISSSSLRSRLLGTLLTPRKDTSHLPPLPYVIGLTGGSGSGKSSIARQLEALGAVRIDCDKLGHEVYQLGTAAYHKVIETFGSGKQVCVVDAAVLLEAGWTDMVHEVWVTVIPEEEAVLRITERDGITKDDALRRLQSQWSNTKQVEHANVVLSTLWEPEVTRKQVLKAWNLLQQRIQQQQ
ncbi:hypothetical protein INR49_005589 [Caranx melampygus]|nr:hypothetical protein INR49_005589 [Caranx melampygus]